MSLNLWKLLLPEAEKDNRMSQKIFKVVFRAYQICFPYDRKQALMRRRSSGNCEKKIAGSH